MNKKRSTLNKIAVIASVAPACLSNWSKPIVNSVLLPSHAQTSLCNIDIQVTISGGNSTTTVPERVDPSFLPQYGTPNVWFFTTDASAGIEASPTERREPVLAQFSVASPYTLSQYSHTFRVLDRSEYDSILIDVLDVDTVLCSYAIVTFWG